MKEWRKGQKALKLIEGNIALVDAEAVVNAANKSLILGGGVAGAIRSFGGPSIQEECNSIGPIEVGEAVITGAGKLKAKYVIHAAGPVYGEGNEDEKLRKATRNSLEIAEKKKLKNIAFPAISAGIFRFPIKRCSEIMIKTCLDFLKKHDYPKEIIFCLYGDKSFSVFEETLDHIEK
ncbi:MAG TPA: macro domain-containing protein [Acidobacteriota bacterium]|nr:macro domain-containing protein [Acidobacteriota bacterium]